MSEPIKIKVVAVKLSEEQKGMKLVTATIPPATESKIYKFSELKQDGTARYGWNDVKDGQEYNVFINGDYIASAKSLQPAGGGFKGGGFTKQPYKQDPQTQREIIRQSCTGYAVTLICSHKWPEGTTLVDRCNATIAMARNFENYVRGGI